MHFAIFLTTHLQNFDIYPNPTRGRPLKCSSPRTEILVAPLLMTRILLFICFNIYFSIDVNNLKMLTYKIVRSLLILVQGNAMEIYILVFSVTS